MQISRISYSVIKYQATNNVTKSHLQIKEVICSIKLYYSKISLITIFNKIIYSNNNKTEIKRTLQIKCKTP